RKMLAARFNRLNVAPNSLNLQLRPPLSHPKATMRLRISVFENSCKMTWRMVSRHKMSRRQKGIMSGKPPLELGRYLRSLREGRGDPQWRVAAAAEMDSASL